MSLLSRINNSREYFLKDCSLSEGPVEKGGYYLDSDDLWGISLNIQTERMRFINGILHFNYPGLGFQANPAYIAWFGLLCLNRFIRENDTFYLDKAMAHGRWLKENAVLWKDALRWEYKFDFKSGSMVMKNPWPSAIAQGLAISLLFRLFKITGDADMLRTANSAARLYEIPAEEGGVAVKINGGIYFEEYPVYPLTLVLDGTLFSLLGLYDLSSHNYSAKELFDAGIATVNKSWKVWDWHRLWSRYGNTGYLSTLAYHRLNCKLVEIFQRKGYLKSFPLSGWKRGIHLANIIAILQLQKSALRYIGG